MPTKIDTAIFIERAKIVHNDLYDYSDSVYINAKEKIVIICKLHGEFKQLPYQHVNGIGCPECGKLRSSETKIQKGNNQFVKRARSIHGDLYDYSKSVYTGVRKQIIIICRKHGEFTQTPSNHNNHGHGCRACAGTLKITQDDFVLRASDVHNNTYDYSKSIYVNALTQIIITCKEHGDFMQDPHSHLAGHGCLECSGKQKLTTADFICRSNEIHNGRYDYSLVDYKNAKTSVTIRCQVHDILFEQNPDAHYYGAANCPSCIATKVSGAERDILQYIETIYTGKIIGSDRTVLKPKELDIYIPELKLAFEYCGLYWHSDQYKSPEYHADKYNKCREAGVRLVTIFENEWIHQAPIVKNKIKQLLSNVINVDNCTVSDNSTHDIQKFKKAYCFDVKPADIDLALMRDDELIAVMSLMHNGNNIEIIDIVSSVPINNDLSKFIEFIDANYVYEQLTHNIDLRWGDVSAHTSNGFHLHYISPPDYRLIEGQQTYPKQHGCNGNKIYDCGSMLFTKYKS